MLAKLAEDDSPDAEAAAGLAGVTAAAVMADGTSPAGVKAAVEAQQLLHPAWEAAVPREQMPDDDWSGAGDVLALANCCRVSPQRH